jgi:hypothetical protein
MAKRRVGVEYSPSMREPVRPGAVSPDRALCLPTFCHFLIVNTTSLSLTHSPSHSPSPSSSLSLSLSLSPPPPPLSLCHTTVREMALKRSLRCGTWEQSPPRSWGGTSPRPSTLADTRTPCFEVEKHALRLGARAHYLPTNLGPSPLRTGSL